MLHAYGGVCCGRILQSVRIEQPMSPEMHATRDALSEEHMHAMLRRYDA